MKILGVVLVVLGLVGLIWGGISWTTRDTVLDAGPVEITKNKTESIPLPPIAGAILVLAGAVVLVKGSRG